MGQLERTHGAYVDDFTTASRIGPSEGATSFIAYVLDNQKAGKTTVGDAFDRALERVGYQYEGVMGPVASQKVIDNKYPAEAASIAVARDRLNIPAPTR